MARRIVFKIALVFAVAVAGYLYLRDRTPDLVTMITPEQIASMEDRLTGLSPIMYDRHDVPLWTDRSYHTFQFAPRLKERVWLPLGRNEERPYVIHVEQATEVFTLANRLDLRGVEDWEVLRDTLLVDDSYAPRRMDVLLSKHLEPGVYRVRSPEGGPSKPVFWDPRSARLVP